MGIAKGGCLAILAGAGPMGLGAIDYALNCEPKPRMIVVTDVDQSRLDRAAKLFPVVNAQNQGIVLHFVNTSDYIDPVAYLLTLTNGDGYDDVFVYAPVNSVVEQADRILGKDGCLNFFAGPTDTGFKAEINFYNVHYGATHIVGTTGGNTDDMLESLALTARQVINPAVMVTHIGGLNSVAEATLHLPDQPAGKKLVYTHITMDMTAISDFQKLGETDTRYKKLAEITQANNGLWCLEAEQYLMENWK